ncbi:HEAT repeat domain-containing protein [Candidatus Sumerlaeota bacterium]|nr:HEAT repeat domain-containing protein [Candidatus Sumerlaeota bacterium]
MAGQRASLLRRDVLGYGKLLPRCAGKGWKSAAGIEEMTDPEPQETKIEDPSAGTAHQPETPPEEELAATSVVGFILVPAMLVVMVVGIGWVFWYLTYNPYSPQDYARLLKSENKSTRWQAALDMVETNRATKELVPILVEMAHAKAEDQAVVDTMNFDARDILKSPEERQVNLRWYAVAALAKIGGDRAFETLTELITDTDKGVRFYAAHGLGRLGKPESVAPLIERLGKDEDGGVRSAAAWALGEIGGAQAKEPLLAAFKGDTEKDVQWNAALALSRFGEASVQDVLVEMTKADNPHTRDQARRALMLLRDSGKK